MNIILRINKIIKVIYLIYVFLYLHIYIYIYITNCYSKIIIKTLIIFITNLFYECDDDKNDNSMYTI